MLCRKCAKVTPKAELASGGKIRGLSLECSHKMLCCPECGGKIFYSENVTSTLQEVA